MKEFDIELARQGKPVCTKDGREVEILTFESKNNFPIVGLVTMDDGKQVPINWDDKGKCLYRPIMLKNGDCDSDLMMVAEKHEGWVNIFIDEADKQYETVGVYDTREEALNYTSNEGSLRYITTIKIGWEE